MKMRWRGPHNSRSCWPPTIYQIAIESTSRYQIIQFFSLYNHIYLVLIRVSFIITLLRVMDHVASFKRLFGFPSMLLIHERLPKNDVLLQHYTVCFSCKEFSWMQNTTSTHSNNFGGYMYHLLLLCWDTERDWTLRRATTVSVIRPRVAIRLPPPAPWKRV